MQLGLRNIDVELNLPIYIAAKEAGKFNILTWAPGSVGRNGVVYLKKKEKKIKDFGRPPSISASRGKWEDRLAMKEAEVAVLCGHEEILKYVYTQSMSGVDRSGWEVGKRPRRGQAKESPDSIILEN